MASANQAAEKTLLDSPMGLILQGRQAVRGRALSTMHMEPFGESAEACVDVPSLCPPAYWTTLNQLFETTPRIDLLSLQMAAQRLQWLQSIFILLSLITCLAGKQSFICCATKLNTQCGENVKIKWSVELERDTKRAHKETPTVYKHLSKLYLNLV